MILRFKAKCKVVTKDVYKETHPVANDLRPNLFLKGMYFCCCITEVQFPILPGESGEILILALCEEHCHYFCRGDYFELREGPYTLAQCEIISDVEEANIPRNDSPLK